MTDKTEVTQRAAELTAYILDALLVATEPNMLSPDDAEALIHNAIAEFEHETRIAGKRTGMERERTTTIAWLERESLERGKKTEDGWALHWAADAIRRGEHTEQAIRAQAGEAS